MIFKDCHSILSLHVQYFATSVLIQTGCWSRITIIYKKIFTLAKYSNRHYVWMRKKFFTKKYKYSMDISQKLDKPYFTINSTNFSSVNNEIAITLTLCKVFVFLLSRPIPPINRNNFSRIISFFSFHVCQQQFFSNVSRRLNMQAIQLSNINTIIFIWKKVKVKYATVQHDRS
jgi:hypothetical protein